MSHFKQLLQEVLTTMDIPSGMPVLWWENSNGDKWFADMYGSGYQEPPIGFVYQHSRFPSYLRHTIRKITQKSEVDKCPHPEESLQSTYGWGLGIQGRKCNKCGGDQTGNVGEPWPYEWNAHGCRKIMTGESGYPGELVVALVNSGEYDFSDAVLVAANSCERCLNALLWEYEVLDKDGEREGYEELGKEWLEANTSCEFCQGSNS